MDWFLRYQEHLSSSRGHSLFSNNQIEAVNVLDEEIEPAWLRMSPNSEQIDKLNGVPTCHRSIKKMAGETADEAEGTKPEMRSRRSLEKGSTGKQNKTKQPEKQNPEQQSESQIDYSCFGRDRGWD